MKTPNMQESDHAKSNRRNVKGFHFGNFFLDSFWASILGSTFFLESFWVSILETFFGQFLGFHFGNPELESRAIKIEKQMVRMLLLEI